MASMEEVLEAVQNIWHPTMIEVAAEKILICVDDYDIGDVLSESTTIGTFWRYKNIARVEGGGGYIVKSLITAETTAIASWLSLFLFTARPHSLANDDAACNAPLLADRDIYVGRIDHPACDNLGTGQSETMATPSTIGKLPMAFVCSYDSRDLWGLMVIRNVVDLANDTVMRSTLIAEQY